jgi:hypothetical protein
LSREDEEGVGDRPPWKERILQRMPETGVGLFIVFLVALVIGLVLALSGHLTWSKVLLAVAIVSVLASLLTPSPATRARRAAVENPPEDTGTDKAEAGEGPTEEGAVGPELVADGAAPTSRRRDVPAPPPEPPPMEDVVVDLEGEGEARPEGNEDVWVE